MQYKSSQSENEIDLIDKRLFILIKFLDIFTLQKFGKQITITELFRTQSEQDNIYADNQEYKIHPWKSVHQFGRGADIRAVNFTKEEQDEIIFMMNKYPYGDGKHNTILLHDVGDGLHFHLQVIAGS